jgi:hypothetical protein
MADIKELLKEATKDLLSPESLTLIEQAIDEKAEQKAKLQVETALVALDDKHAEMLKKLMEKMDSDYTVKLEKLIKRLDESYAVKLTNVKKHYDKKLAAANTQLTTEATKYVGDLQGKINSFLETSIDKLLPADKLNEAVQNVKAVRILEQIRDLVGINEDAIRTEVKEAIIDGKKQLDESKTQLEKVITENAELKKQIDAQNAQLLLEQKTAKLPTKKREHIKKVLGDKDVKFINENFQYVCEMYDRDEVVLVEKAKAEAKPVAKDVDAPKVIVESNEKKDPIADPEYARVHTYLQGM